MIVLCIHLVNEVVKHRDKEFSINVTVAAKLKQLCKKSVAQRQKDKSSCAEVPYGCATDAEPDSL